MLREIRTRSLWSMILLTLLCSACGGAVPTTPSDPAPPQPPPAPQPPPSPQSADRLSFVTQPTNTEAGASFTVVVKVVDAAGVLVSDWTGAVTVGIAARPSDGTLTGVTTVSPVAGLATFTGLSIERAGQGYALAASSGSLVPATSTAFGITPAQAARLIFKTQPPNATAGAAISFTLGILDAFDNPVVGFVGTATVALGANPSGGTLSGTTSVDFSGGMATFSDLWIDKAGGGYTFVASSPGLASATSAGFGITPGTVSFMWLNPSAARLTFPVGEISVQLVANARDDFENPVSVQVVWSSSKPSVAAVSTQGFVTGDATGVATITASSGAYQATALIVTDCVTPRCSGTFHDLTQPSDGTSAGEPLVPPIIYSTQSTGGTASIALGQNPTGATLTGNADRIITGGTATWPDLRIDRPGTYTLVVAVEYVNSADGKVTNAFLVVE